jgi:hypothetical protein
MYWDCQYWSFQRCVANVVADNRGFCNQNPSFVPTAASDALRRGQRGARSSMSATMSPQRSLGFPKAAIH